MEPPIFFYHSPRTRIVMAFFLKVHYTYACAREAGISDYLFYKSPDKHTIGKIKNAKVIPKKTQMCNALNRI